MQVHQKPIDEMERIKIGTGPNELSPGKVDGAMRESLTYSELCRHWRRFARNLFQNDKQSERAILILDGELNRTLPLSYEELPYKILNAWIAEKGRRANLKWVHQALIEMGLTEVAESLEKFSTESSSTIIDTPRTPSFIQDLMMRLRRRLRSWKSWQNLTITRDPEGPPLTFNVSGRIFTLEEINAWKIHFIPGSNPLHSAVYRGILQIVKFLLGEYRDKVKDMKYVLHACLTDSAENSEAVITEKIEIIKCLLEINADWREEKLDQCTPLLQPRAHIKLLKCLVEHGADINAYSPLHGTILHQTFDRTTYSDLFQWAISQDFGHINSRDSDLLTPLAYAVKHELLVDVELLHSFQKAGANFTATDKKGDPILFLALQKSSSLDFIKQTLEYGGKANVNHETSEKNNAAHIVIARAASTELNAAGVLEILKLLISYGFKLIDKPNSSGMTPLLKAMGEIDMDTYLVDFFHDCQANFDRKDNENTSVLFLAIVNNQSVKIIEKIVEFGGNVNHCNKLGLNALHMAALFGRYLPIEYLVNALDVNFVDNEGNTSLHLLFSLVGKDYRRTLELLLRNGSKFEMRNNDGHVPLVKWIINCEQNVYSTILESESKLPFTKEIASSTLTYLVRQYESRQKYLHDSSEEENDAFKRFVSLLIDKNATFMHCNETPFDWGKVKQKGMKKLDKIILIDTKFIEHLKTREQMYAYNVAISTPNITFQYLAGRTKISFEIVIDCLLANDEIDKFFQVCRIIEKYNKSQ